MDSYLFLRSEKGGNAEASCFTYREGAGLARQRFEISGAACVTCRGKSRRSLGRRTGEGLVASAALDNAASASASDAGACLGGCLKLLLEDGFIEQRHLQHGLLSSALGRGVGR